LEQKFSTTSFPRTNEKNRKTAKNMTAIWFWLQVWFLLYYYKW